MNADEMVYCSLLQGTFNLRGQICTPMGQLFKINDVVS